MPPSSARPLVSVPVLSMTRFTARAMVSSTGPPFISTPRRAAFPMPAMMATGTARMSGHGVAETSTASMRMWSPVKYQVPPASATVTNRNTSA